MMRGKVLTAVLLLGLVALVRSTAPIARMITVTVARNSEVLVQFAGYDRDGDELEVYITELPEVGSVHQLSQVFSDYGHNPKRGVQVKSVSPRVRVTGSGHRVVYTPPANTNYPSGKWAVMKYVVSDGLSESEEGIVWLVPPHKRMVFSDFSLTVDGWSVVDNGAREAAKANGGLAHEPYGRGLLNHYILATDAEINKNSRTGGDKNLWYFHAPIKFLNNHIVAYGGLLEFSMGSSAGDFSVDNLNSKTKLVVMECASCASGSGIRLAIFAGAGNYVLDGKDRRLSIPLKETNWLKDPKNTLLPWTVPSQCEMVEVLAGITKLEILGDHTRWYESVAIDDVAFLHGSSVPVSCASIYY